MKHLVRLAALASILLISACGDDAGRDPVAPGEPPAGFAVIAPAAVVRDQAFDVTVTALDAEGSRDMAWSGTVTLSATAGTISPGTVHIQDGTATVQVALSGHAGETSLRAGSGAVQSEAAAILVLSDAAPARVEVSPSAALVTGAGETQAFTAQAFDAQGAPTAAQIEWRTNDPTTLSINAGGVATAAVAVGSAQVFASAEGVESMPAVMLIAQPTGTPVLLADSQIVSDPEPVDETAPFEPGWQYRVRVTNATLQTGDIVMGVEERALAGRVVAIVPQGTESQLTVALVALDQLFTDLRIDETIPLAEMPAEGAGPDGQRVPRGVLPGFAAAAGDTFTVAGFKCTATGSAPSLSLGGATWNVEPTLALELIYGNALERLVVSGEIVASFTYKPVLNATFEGRIGCERTALTATIPVGGILSLFFGIQVPLGVGLEMDGKLEIAQVGFDVSASASASAELGMTCLPSGACTAITAFDAQRDGSFELIAPAPSQQLRISLGGHGYLFAKPGLGSSLWKKAQFEVISASAGLKQTVSLATREGQVADTAYASSFELARVLKVGAGSDLEKAITGLGKRLGVDLDLDLSLIDDNTNIAASPRGRFSITPPRVAPGDSVTPGDLARFTIELDTVDYLGSYAVDAVEIAWKQDDGSGGFTLELARPACASIPTAAGRKTFECETDFLDEHIGEQTFYAFVYPTLFGTPLPVPLEIALDARASVEVGNCRQVASLTLSTQAHVAAAAGVCETGSLIVAEAPGTADPIVDLTPLDSLRRVRQALGIGPTSQLTSLAGLEHVTVDTAAIMISENAALASLASLGASAGSRSATVTDVTISSNPVLSDLTWIANLLAPGATVLNNVNISDNQALATMDLAGSIGSAGNVAVAYNDALASVSALDGISADNIAISHNDALGVVTLSSADARGITLTGNTGLTAVNIAIAGGRDTAFVTVSGSDRLATVAVKGPAAGSGGISLTSLPALASVSISGYATLRNLWLGPAPSLTSFTGGGAVVTHWLDLHQTGLASLNGLGVADAMPNRFIIRFNDQLTTLAGFSNLGYVGDMFWIYSNPKLCVPSWAQSVSMGTGNSPNIAGNKAGC